jgi:yeast amino acid transporter
LIIILTTCFYQFIVLSGVIGGGIFTDNGQALKLAGPLGLLLSVLLIGVVAFCVGECISELTQKFPVYGAIVEFVQVFVDEELGWVIGIEYWCESTVSRSIKS